MKIRQLLPMGIAALSIFNASCGDEDRPLVPEDIVLADQPAYAYFPLDPGSWWVYESSYYDDSNKQMIGDNYPITEDSIWVAEIAAHEGRKAARLVKYDGEDMETTEMWYSLEGNKILLHYPESLFGPINGWIVEHSLQNGYIVNVDEILIEDDFQYHYLHKIQTVDGGMAEVAGASGNSRWSYIKINIAEEWYNDDPLITEVNRYLENIGKVEYRNVQTMIEIINDQENVYSDRAVLLRWGKE
jgi:hypothetical protein